MTVNFSTTRSAKAGDKVLPIATRLPVPAALGYSEIHKRYGEIFGLATFQQDGLEPVVHCMNEDDELRVYFKSVSNESTAKWINSRLKNGDTRFRVTKDFSEVIHSKVIGLMVVALPDQLRKYEELLSKEASIAHVLSEDIYCKGFFWLELYHTNANKGYAVQVLKTYLGLDYVVCFGDNVNDLPMFEQSTKSFAVRNAKEAVKRFASATIASNNEEGVARYIQENVATSTSL